MSASKIKEEWKDDCVGQAAKTASSGTALCSVRQNRSDVQIYLAYSMYPVALRIDRLDYFFAVKKDNIITNESTVKTASSNGAQRAFTILCYLWLIKVFGSIGWLCVCSDAF